MNEIKKLTKGKSSTQIIQLDDECFDNYPQTSTKESHMDFLIACKNKLKNKHSLYQENPQIENQYSETDSPMKYKNFLQQKRDELEKNIMERKSKNSEKIVLSEKRQEKNIIYDNYKADDFNFHGIDKPKLKNSVYKTLSKLKPILTNQIHPKSNGRVKSVEKKIIPKHEDQSVFDTLLGNYMVGPVLGEGSSAQVKLAKEKLTEQLFAVKIYDKYRLNNIKQQRVVQREINLMKDINHPNIIKFIEIIETKSSINIIMEYIGTRSLNRYLQSISNKRLDEQEAKIIFCQVVRGIRYLHSNDIVHRDIKLENILLDQNRQVKIIDLGFSQKVEQNKYFNNYCGTSAFMCPEITLKQPYNGKKSDIWALGVVLFYILNGYLPFRGNNEIELHKRIQSGQFEFHDQVSVQAISLVANMLKLDPKKRFTADDILNDEWLKDFN